MKDIDELEERIKAWWIEEWDGIDSYERVLTYVTFGAVGFGFGGMFAIRKLIIENPQYLTESLAADTQAVTKMVVGIAIAVIVVSQLTLSLLYRRFPDD